MKRRFPLARTAFGISFVILAAAALRIVLVDDPLGGRPVTEVSISTAQNANRVAGEVATEPADEGSPDVIEAVELPANGPTIITVDEGAVEAAEEAQTETADLGDFGTRPELLEDTQIGAIPRIGTDGTTPFEAYARASVGPAAANGRPLIAVVVTGLGLNENGTLDAIEQLPDNITLSFAPYGETLPTTVGAARAEGHEIMLEIPLEPFDYPDNDPGPQTLLTGQPPRANLEKLVWLMGRLGGYIGVVNHMGARFTASAGDFGPVMEEFGARGLAYLDDGSSNRSLAPQLADANQVPFARANSEIDANPSRAAILDALERLEDTARSEGSAIGIATALPVSISTVSEWARGLEDKGILLVPVSALMEHP